ncbi:hypothetical protein COO60DRAFT_346371 [Scenedesmus sp. NREL 46B-D3]|nr:hypothetical protein COO60DRAFT_346371 [Scenedesmus sp. NREL 46B-D3]
MTRATLGVLLLALVLCCPPCCSAQTGLELHDTSRRMLQQEQFPNTPIEQDVSAYLAERPTAAGLTLEDQQPDLSQNDKAPSVQLAQPLAPNLLRLLSTSATARGNPARRGPGPGYPGLSVSRPSSFGAAESAAVFDSATGGFGVPGSDQLYQLPERLRHYQDADHLPNMPEPQQRQEQQQGYIPESAQLSNHEQQQQQQQQQPGGITRPISSFIAKLRGRVRKSGSSQDGVVHDLMHASAAGLEAAPMGPPSLDASAKHQLEHQPGISTFDSRLEGGHNNADAATEELSAHLGGPGPELAQQQLMGVLNQAGNRPASVSEGTTRKVYIPQEEAVLLVSEASDAAGSSGNNQVGDSVQNGVAEALQQTEQQQQDVMDGRNGHSGYGGIVTDNIVLADPHETERDAVKVNDDATAIAGKPVEVGILQVDPKVSAGSGQATAQTFGQIQAEAAAVAAAAAADESRFYSQRSQLQPLDQQPDYVPRDEVAASTGLASNLMPASEELSSYTSAAGSNQGPKRRLHAGAAAGIALGAFAVVMVGAKVLLLAQTRRKGRERKGQDADCGYTPTAPAEDVEVAEMPPAEVQAGCRTSLCCMPQQASPTCGQQQKDQQHNQLQSHLQLLSGSSGVLQ